MAEFKSVDDFLKYRGSESGGGNRLKGNWQKDRGYLNWWFHRQMFPSAVWLHSFPELVVRTDRNTNEVKKNVWGRKAVCWEDEKILKKQRFRTPDGHREHPPKNCSQCRLAEALREMILSGAIKDTDVVFRIGGADDVREDRELHAGGLCGYWGRDLDEPTKKRLAAAGIYMGNMPGKPGVWSETMLAKLSYVFTGVDHDNLEGGVVTTIQGQLIGDKVKRCMNNEIASKDEKGNPFLNPYCIRVVYKPDEKKFDDKYDALRIDRYPLTEQIDQLLSSEKPNIEKFTKRFDQVLFRAQVERFATVDLPFASIFDVPGPEAAGEEAPPVGVSPPKTTAQVPADVGKKAEAKSEAAPTIPCDDCGTPMLETDTKCKKCGAVYQVDAPEPAKAAAPAPAAAPATAPAAAKPGGLAPPEDDGMYETDEIPF